MPTKKKAAKKSAKVKSTAGRNSKFDGKVLHKLADKNPRREGTNGFKSFALIKNGMTYEKFIEAGGRRVDLDFDIKKKYVELKSA